MNELGNTPADKDYKSSGISRAEERAFEAYPVYMVRRRYDGIARSDDPYDSNLHNRFVYQQGYEQAEKDLALTWDDMKTIVQILADTDWYDFEISDKLWSQEFYEEVLKRFKETKK